MADVINFRTEKLLHLLRKALEEVEQRRLAGKITQEDIGDLLKLKARA